jgi:hypothetical protein
MLHYRARKSLVLRHIRTGFFHQPHCAFKHDSVFQDCVLRQHRVVFFQILAVALLAESPRLPEIIILRYTLAALPTNLLKHFMPPIKGYNLRLRFPSWALPMIIIAKIFLQIPTNFLIGRVTVDDGHI